MTRRKSVANCQAVILSSALYKFTLESRPLLNNQPQPFRLLHSQDVLFALELLPRRRVRPSLQGGGRHGQGRSHPGRRRRRFRRCLRCRRVQGRPRSGERGREAEDAQLQAGDPFVIYLVAPMSSSFLALAFIVISNEFEIFY